MRGMSRVSMPPEISSLFSAPAGWGHAMGLRLLRTDKDLVELEWTVDDRHMQPFGIVHGGVFSGVVETVCSVGAAVGQPPGKGIVGMENHTSLLRPVRSGVLHAQGRPVHRGRSTELWEATIVDADARLVATGRLRMMVIDLPTAKSNEQA
jgi:1,4-dihydroxy-2-naphthoyl-CoA hydrolase